ncbi:2,3-bisphosphoglycerate-independent phosphoglycerate mutase [Candidatus Margulisiibacteriota bacterium]
MLYLCILDGFGIGKETDSDAIAAAIKDGRAPFFKELFESHPYAKLECSGEAVGLPPGTMGNSEVNHLNMGAGRVVFQSLLRVNKAIENQSFSSNKAIVKAMEHCQKKKSTLHLMGILQGGQGCVHGNIEHLFGLLRMSVLYGLKKIVIHIFTDGRDTDPHAAGEEYVPRLTVKIKELNLENEVKIGTIMGRAYAMDRDVNWKLILKAIKAIVNGEGVRRESDVRNAIGVAYAQESEVEVKGKMEKVMETDEFIQPTIIGDYKGINPEDAMIFWNFRQDRGIELTTAMRETDRKYFNFKPGQPEITERMYQEIIYLQNKIKEIPFVAMTEYYFQMNAAAAFPEAQLNNTVGELVAQAGKQQLRLAGPEKFVHVTSWFSGRRPDPFEGEDRILATDPNLKRRTNDGKNYNWSPEMTAYIETEEALKAIASKKYDLIVHNFQNGDMVGHTGDFSAAKSSISVLSDCVQHIYKAVLAQKGKIIITADHGNADQMVIDQMVVSTQHSTNPVPCWIFGAKGKIAEEGIVPDVGTTVVKLLGLKPSKEMTGKVLIS